jgi:hypothetical protein
MKTKQVKEADDPLIELFRTVEDGLAIAGSKSKSELGLSLDTAELELNLAIKTKADGGLQVEALGINASAKVELKSRHTYKLKLRRSVEEFNMGSPTAQELAETILALATATQSIASRASNFIVDEAVVTVDISQTKEGTLKIFGGGGSGAESLYRITLTFTKRQR